MSDGTPPWRSTRERVLVDVGREQHLEAGDVLLEDLEHAVVDPAPAERDARRLLAQVQARGAVIDRLLEEGDARLAPEPAAEEER